MDVAEYQTTTPTVLAAADSTAEWVSAALSGQASVRSCQDPTEALTQAAAVDCVVLGDDVDDLRATIRDLREHDADLPIVVSVAGGDAATLAGASRAGATRVCLREAADLEATVTTLVERFDRHRQQRREGRMFRSILGSFPQSVYVKDEEARLIACSDTLEKAVEGDPIGKTDLELFGGTAGEDNARESVEDDREVIDGGDPIVAKEERHDREDGETLWLRTSKFPWIVDGDVVGLVGETRDVTAMKRREQELEQEKQRLEQFASFASHDLRNPLSVADGHLQHAIDTGDHDSLTAASDALDDMERLIDDLLNIVEPGSSRADEQWTDLVDVTERAWEAVDTPEATRSIDLPGDLQIRAASGALRQLLENLLANAVEHGGPDVAVTVGTLPTGFFVADDGPGIPAAEREQVFEHGYTTGGSGVGLAVAAEIADAHDWDISVTESEGGGARFEVSRCLRRRADEPEPVEGEAVTLSATTTVGDTDVAGESTQAADGSWRLRGAGRAVWGGIEEYTAVHASIDGDCRIEARLTELTQVHEYSKAGLLVAGAIEAGRPFGFIGATAVHGHEAAWRPTPGDSIDTTQIGEGEVTPSWYRIDRIGDRLTCYTSTDGESWRPVDQFVLPFDATVAAGIVINSHEAGQPSEGVFEHVRLVELDRTA